MKLFEQAIEVDPNYARAYAWRACSLSWNGDWFPERYKPNEIFELCTQSASKALEMDPNDHEAHRIMGSISMKKRDCTTLGLSSYVLVMLIFLEKMLQP